MKRSSFGLVFLSLFAVVPLAHAGQGKAGLWEVSTKMNLGAAMPAMPAMTPEQQAMMKQMGIEVPTVGGGAITTKQCVTAAQAAEDIIPPPGDAADGCRTSAPVVSGNTTSVTITCDGNMKGSGKASITHNGDSAYTGTFTMKGTAEGQPVDIKSDFSGKWLGADCGSVKPLVQ